jgi:hypothetical protein
MSLIEFEQTCRENQNKILPTFQEIIDSVTSVMISDFPDPYYLPTIEFQRNFLNEMKAKYPINNVSDINQYKEVLVKLYKESQIAFYYNRISLNRVESRLIFEGTNPKESEAAAYNSKTLYEFYAPFADLTYGEDLRLFFEMRKTLLGFNYSIMSYLDFLIMNLTCINPILNKLHFYKISWVKAFLNEISDALKDNSNPHYKKLLANLESSSKVMNQESEMSNMYLNNFGEYLTAEILEMDKPNNYENILVHVNIDAYLKAKNYNMWDKYFLNFNYDPHYDYELAKFLNLNLLFNDRPQLQSNPVVSIYIQLHRDEIKSKCYDFRDSCKMNYSVTLVALDYYSKIIENKKLDRSELYLFVSIEGFTSCAENEEERKRQLSLVVKIIMNTKDGVVLPFYLKYLDLRNKQLESCLTDDQKEELFDLKMKLYDTLYENETPQINMIKKCELLFASFGALTLFV